jgi:HSP20 family protein
LVDLPGVDPKDIQISIEDNFLTIKGEKESKHQTTEDKYSKVERYFGKFYRRFALPDYLDHEQISAKTKHGVLEISIPKKEQRVLKKIEIKTEE